MFAARRSSYRFLTALLLCSAWSAGGQELGFDPTNVLVLNPEFRDALPLDEQAAAYRLALAAVRELDEVESAVAVATMPFGPRIAMMLAIPGYEANPWSGRQLPYLNPVAPEYFAVLGIQQVAGRGFAPSDDAPGAAPVVLVEERMADFLWPGESPLGKCFHILDGPPDADGDTEVRRRSAAPGGQTPAGEPSRPNPCREIVGVVNTSRRAHRADADQLMQFYMPVSQFPLPAGVDELPSWGIIVRTRSDAATAAVEAVVTAFRESTAMIVGVQAKTLQEMIDG